MDDAEIDGKYLRAYVERLVEEIKQKNPSIRMNKWIPAQEAMKCLGISSSITLDVLVKDRKIKRNQPENEYVLYDVESIEDYIKKNSH